MEENKPLVLKISEAADLSDVSTVTVRNWIKTGYLIEERKGYITKESLEKFLSEIAGVEKLKSRANKLKKDNHKHNCSIEKIKEKLSRLSGDDLSDEYESSLSNSYRNKEGIYYTPISIVNDMFEGVEVTDETKFLDPCCGSGNFIIEAIKKGVKPQNVFGYDVDQNAVDIVKKRIFEETSYLTQNIKCADFLSEAKILSERKEKFNLIFTNPPWGKKIKKLDKEKIAKTYAAGKSTDTSSLFLFASLSILENKGSLGFLVQDAFFNIASFEDARKSLLEYKIERLVDYGKAFKGLISGAQAFILRNESFKKSYMLKCSYKGESYMRKQEYFGLNPKSIFNFWLNNEENETIEKVYSVPHIRLEGRAKWALGIVTGNNAKFCVDTPSKDYLPVYKGTDISKKGFKPASCYIFNDFSKYQQVSPLEMYKTKNKIVYRFISSRLVFCLDEEQRYILNSANLLILSEGVGITPKQLCDLFNSDFMNWLFKGLFNTHKILRRDLEALPIHTKYFKENAKFVENDYLDFLGLQRVGKDYYMVKKTSL